MGYNDAGLDDVWQKCGSYGPENYTYHDGAGNPVVDVDKFPDMKRCSPSPLFVQWGKFDFVYLIATMPGHA